MFDLQIAGFPGAIVLIANVVLQVPTSVSAANYLLQTFSFTSRLKRTPMTAVVQPTSSM